MSIVWTFLNNVLDKLLRLFIYLLTPFSVLKYHHDLIVTNTTKKEDQGELDKITLD